MITAQEARNLVAAPIEAELIAIEAAIKKAAGSGKTILKYRGTQLQFSDGALYNIARAEDYPLFVKQVIASLRSLGYSAEIVSENGALADLWLQIRW